LPLLLHKRMNKNMQEKVTHVIFDMDGLLINSEDLYSEAFQNILTPFDKTYDWSLKMHIMGMKPDVAAQYVIDKLDLPLTVGEWKNKLGEQLKTIFSQTQFLPGAEKLIAHLKKHNIPIALCSGSSKAAFEAKTNHLGDFFNAFDPRVLCGDDSEVKHGKPHPDAYLVTMKRFKNQPVKSSDCLVFEDAPNGVKSAIGANMRCVMIPHPKANMPESLTKDATLILPSLLDFEPELFGLPPFE